MLYQNQKDDEKLAKTIKSLQDIANGASKEDGNSTAVRSGKASTNATSFIVVPAGNPFLACALLFAAGVAIRVFGPFGRRSAYTARLLSAAGEPQVL